MELPQHPRIRPLTLKTVLAQKQPPGSFSVGAGARVLEALQVMAEREVGAVLVRDGDRVVGLFSERDWVRHTVSGGSPAPVTPVREVMTDGVVFATLAHTVSACLTLMTEQRLRYLPVIEDGHRVDLLSIDDLLKAILAHQERVLEAIALDQLVLFARGTYSC